MAKDAIPRKRALFQAYVRLPFSLNYFQYIQGRTRSETIKHMRKIEHKISEARDAKYNKKSLFLHAMSFYRLSTRSYVINLIDYSIITTPPQSMTHFSEHLASTYYTDDLLISLTLPICPEEMPLVKIALTLLSGILSSLNSAMSLDPQNFHPRFFRLLAAIIFQPLATHFALSRLVMSRTTGTGL